MGQRIVGIGEILWDMLPSGKQLGGAPTNFAYHAKCLGADAAVVSCVGDDELGREILQRVSELGLDAAFIAIDPAHPTGTVEVKVDEKGVPEFTIKTGVAWDFIPFSERLAELARTADAVCFGSLAQRSPASHETIRRFISETRADCLRIFDINLRQAFYTTQIIDDSLRICEVLKLNDQELPILAEMFGLDGSADDVANRLGDRYSLRMVALTRGGKGSRLYTENGTFDHPGFPTKIVDTVGAGDAFTAMLAVRMLRGDLPDQINERANRLASYVCSQPGATPPIPAEL